MCYCNKIDNILDWIPGPGTLISLQVPTGTSSSSYRTSLKADHHNNSLCTTYHFGANGRDPALDIEESTYVFYFRDTYHLLDHDLRELPQGSIVHMNVIMH